LNKLNDFSDVKDAESGGMVPVNMLADKVNWVRVVKAASDEGMLPRSAFSDNAK
jgi:hypothetical protein